MTDRYQPLRDALAMGPTPGPWRPSYDKGSTRDIFTEQGKLPVCMVRGVTYVGQEQYLANGHFIAACDPDTIHALLSERDALRAENERLRADAERYRFLAERCRSTSEHWGGRWSVVIDGPAPASHNSKDDFDAAIDKAMEASNGN